MNGNKQGHAARRLLAPRTGTTGRHRRAAAAQAAVIHTIRTVLAARTDVFTAAEHRTVVMGKSIGNPFESN